jgi:GT2 family glycosyltransferase
MRGDLGAAAIAYRRSVAGGSVSAMAELRDATLAPYLAAAEAAVHGSAISSDPVTAGRLDGVEGWTATGWVIDERAGEAPPEVLFYRDGVQIASAVPMRFRPDLLEHGFRIGLAGFEVELPIDFGAAERVTISARIASTGQPLHNAPLEVRAPEHLRGWLRRNSGVSGEELALVRARANAGVTKRLSIVMPVYETRADWLREALDSVLAQWCDAWELICIDDGSRLPHVREILADYAARDPRVRPLYLDRNVGIAGATNRAIAAAAGDYVAFMDHDDVLEPDAVERMLEAAESGPGLIYSDEAITGPSIHAIRHIVARPAFSYDYYLSHPYFVHFVAVRRDVARATGGLDETMRISADVDFVLRAIEHAGTVAHVPAALYRWRTHDTSTGHAKKDEVTQATLGALNRHFARAGQAASATEGLGFNGHRIDFADDPAPTLVVIPTRNRLDLLERAVASIGRTTDPATTRILVIDHQSTDRDIRAWFRRMAGRIDVVPYAGPFNFAAMNNLAVKAAGDAFRYLLFCNNDIEAIEPGWLEHMRGLAARDDVGAVGATLLYPDRTIQHAGVTMGLAGLVDHAHKFRPFLRSTSERSLGYNYSLASIRDYSAVTAACLIMRRALFEEVGGFDEGFEIGFNDVDLCLRICALGYKVLNDPYAVLVHHESASRKGTREMEHPGDAQRLRARWSSLMAGADPFYSPLLSLDPPADHAAATPDLVRAAPRVRPVRLPRPA